MLEILQRQDNYVHQYVKNFYSTGKGILAKNLYTKLFRTTISWKEFKSHKRSRDLPRFFCLHLKNCFERHNTFILNYLPVSKIKVTCLFGTYLLYFLKICIFFCKYKRYCKNIPGLVIKQRKDVFQNNPLYGYITQMKCFPMIIFTETC